METQSSFVELKNQLKETSDSISSIFKNKPEKIKTDEIKFRFIHFIDTEVEKIKLEVIQAIKILDSPVYVGLLGRYSHGKSALANALFSIDPDFCLPEGEGVVTSKITSVEFKGNIFRPKCYECYRGGEKSSIDITDFVSNN